ncbi:MAG: DmsC/YnfH family molybdoenzyme membrane anchor subunit, partial [Bacillota bacterium]|nr:DmsC/YnfH family molybdoenzyme membrane anchor subunit [Bacillota bacterium]
MSLISVDVLGVNLNMNLISLVALVLFGIGVLASMIHLGKPARIMNSFNNPKSHLSQEGIIAIVVGMLLMILGLNGLLYNLNTGLQNFLQICVFVFSLMFVFSTGLVYQIFARPAWKTKSVVINFFLSTLSIGSVGTFAWTVFTTGEKTEQLIYISAVTSLCTIIGQLYYSGYVARLGYGVEVRVFDNEFRKVFIAWLITGL